MALSLQELAERLQEGMRGTAETDRPLGRYTTYRLGGPAELYVEPADVEDLSLIADAVSQMDGQVPILPLGRGSNLVISDHGLPGIVIRLGSGFSWIRQGEDTGEAIAGSATSLPQLANWAARRSLGGFEWAISIPGSVGGGVRMNAGAHGGEVSDVLTLVRIFDLRTCEFSDVPADDLALTYRRSRLSEDELVLEARFKFSPGDTTTIRERMEGYRAHRTATQPGALQNAGSVFKNPEGDSAGRLVEAAGLKGFAVRGARVSELHANFFIAGDGATAQDVFDLVHEVKRRVAESSGVDLEPEIRFVGRFVGGDGLDR